MKINVDQLANIIAKELTDYEQKIEKGLEKAQDKVARESVKELKATSPKRYGRYASSWGSTRQGTARVVRNTKHYQLTHLLEKGHAKRGGGRVRAIPHIRPVEQNAIKNLEKEVKDVIRRA